MNLIRSLLLEREGEEPAPDFGVYSETQILHHSVLIIEAGLVHGKVLNGKDGTPRAAALMALTWEGHEFLAAARNAATWKKTTGLLKKVGGSVGLPLLMELLKQEAKKKLGLP